MARKKKISNYLLEITPNNTTLSDIKIEGLLKAHNIKEAQKLIEELADKYARRIFNIILTGEEDKDSSKIAKYQYTVQGRWEKLNKD